MAGPCRRLQPVCDYYEVLRQDSVAVALVVAVNVVPALSRPLDARSTALSSVATKASGNDEAPFSGLIRDCGILWKKPPEPLLTVCFVTGVAATAAVSPVAAGEAD